MPSDRGSSSSSSSSGSSGSSTNGSDSEDDKQRSAFWDRSRNNALGSRAAHKNAEYDYEKKRRNGGGGEGDSEDGSSSDDGSQSSESGEEGGQSGDDDDDDDEEEGRKPQSRRREKWKKLVAASHKNPYIIPGAVGGGVLLLILIVVLVVVNLQEKPAAASAAPTVTVVSGVTVTVAGPTASPTKSQSGNSTGTAASGATGGVATGVAASIASASSMTAASQPTLVMPTAPVAQGDAAIKYIKDSWSVLSGNSDYLSFVADPFGGTGNVLAINYPAGSVASKVAGGVLSLHLDAFGKDNPSRSVISYEVAFEKGFDFVKGGKLPGLYGGDHSGWCTGGQTSTMCLSLRLMWRRDGAGEVYGYYPVYDGYCAGDVGPSVVACTSAAAISMYRGSYTFEVGVWQTVTEVAILNSDPGVPCVANGHVSLYIGDKLAFSVDNAVLRTNASVYFSAFAISSFFGGGDTSWASKGATSYFRNFQFFSGDAPSDLPGESVTAGLTLSGSTATTSDDS